MGILLVGKKWIHSRDLLYNIVYMHNYTLIKLYAFKKCLTNTKPTKVKSRIEKQFTGVKLLVSYQKRRQRPQIILVIILSLS